MTTHQFPPQSYSNMSLTTKQRDTPTRRAPPSLDLLLTFYGGELSLHQMRKRNHLVK